MRNAVLEKAQAGIKIARTNINNLRYADDTTLMAESEEPTVYTYVYSSSLFKSTFSSSTHRISGVSLQYISCIVVKSFAVD